MSGGIVPFAGGTRLLQRGENAACPHSWETGTMRNRVRMVVAFLLTKNPLSDRRLEERWFWYTLLQG